MNKLMKIQIPILFLMFGSLCNFPLATKTSVLICMLQLNPMPTAIGVLLRQPQIVPKTMNFDKWCNELY